MSRTRKKPYTGSKRFDRTCRNHGSCDWCKRNRLYQALKWLEATTKELKEFFNGKD